ncbi:response regulator [Allohahella marinimesophila]|uniref:histidine kinase n=1 Tax=Allohahella marinimesophila TaxID=1054972 RepID=A0ABP7Q579_9GAMM
MIDYPGEQNFLSYFGSAGKHWSLRRKIFTYVMIPAALFAIVIGSVFITARMMELERIVTTRSQETTDQLVNMSALLLERKDQATLSLIAGGAIQKDGVRSVVIYNQRGDIAAHAGAMPAARASQRNLLNTQGSRRRIGDYLQLVEPVWATPPESDNANARPMPTGWVAVEFAYTPTQLAQSRAILLTVLGILLTVFLSAVLASRLSRQLTRPLAHTVDVVSRIKRGDSGARLDIEGSREIELLRDGINSMADTLEHAHSELQQNIDQATEDLRETLETIEIQNIELNIARKEALQASKIKSEFLANMSHEIRTPLNGIIGFARILLKSPLTQQQKDHATTIVKSSETLLSVINDILDFSRIEAGKLLLDHSEFNVRDTIDDAMTLLAPAAHEKNLDLAAMVYLDVPAILVGDPLRVKQIILNLIGNAVKFTRHGEIVLRVMLEDQESSGQHVTIRISVSDTGVGMSKTQQRALFHAFSQGDASTARRFGGSGLGLVISRKLAEQMGGSISVESTLGEGSTFSVLLRLESLGQFATGKRLAMASDESLAPLDYEGSRHYEAPPDLSGERLIYLEYQQRTAMVTQQILQQWSADVVIAESLDDLCEAIVKAQKAGRGFAAAIMGITSYQLSSAVHLAAVERIEKQLDCRVVLLTPTIDSVREHAAILNACTAYALKPIPQRKLAAMMMMLLTKKDKGYATSRQPQSARLFRPKPRVMAVDDNAANLRLIEALLTDIGVEPVAVTSGYEALRLLKETTCDLVFMDVQMPGMDGMETTRLIRSLSGPIAHIPILALTAHALNEEREELLNNGFNEYVTKPISESQLLDLLSRYLQFTQPAKVADEIHQVYSNFSGTVRPSQKAAPEPCVDIESSVRLAAGKRDLAVELLSMLLENLPEDEERFRKLERANDIKGLEEAAHKLHGGTRYCGVPLLRAAVASLEIMLKQKQPWVEPLKQTYAEIDRLLYWADQTDWQPLMLGAPDGLSRSSAG